ncbi:MAG TPA: acyltransferase domain-containing protein, partial [Methylophilaceae bacterium]
MRAFLFPGQGSQRKGMGADLFTQYPEYVKKADAILGYSIEELCVADPEGRINFTAYTQPAIFVVSVLNYLEALKTDTAPDMTAGHSIGEYAALFAAGVFDFETGLRIVQKRAELMSKAEGGALAAVVGLSQDEVKARIAASQLAGIEIANINSPTQIVVGSKAETIQQFAKWSEGQ